MAGHGNLLLSGKDGLQGAVSSSTGRNTGRCQVRQVKHVHAARCDCRTDIPFATLRACRNQHLALAKACPIYKCPLPLRACDRVGRRTLEEVLDVLRGHGQADEVGVGRCSAAVTCTVIGCGYGVPLRYGGQAFVVWLLRGRRSKRERGRQAAAGRERKRLSAMRTASGDSDSGQ